MDCKGARRLIPPDDALANLKGDWERFMCHILGLLGQIRHCIKEAS